MTKKVYLFVAGVWVVAIAATLLLLRLPAQSGEALVAAAWFCGLAGLGQFLIYSRNQENVSGNVAFLPTLSAVVVAPGWQVVLMVAGASLIGELLGRRSLIKQVFNVALGMVSAAAAVAAYALFVQAERFPFAEKPIASVLLGFAVAAATHSVVNTGLVSAVLRVSNGSRIRETWGSILKESLVTDVLTVPFVYVFARVFEALGGWGVAVLAVPLVGMRQLYVANWRLKQINQELLELMVAAIEARDPYTSGHSRRVAEYSRAIAVGLGLSPKQVDEVNRAALLHDVGKMDEKYAPLLRKPSRLTPEEEAIMQTHAARSAELVAKVSSLSSLVAPVRHHHEAWDGTGYPDGLAGERIPLAARIIAFADTIDAMTSERPYRPALSSEVVRAEIVRCRGTQFDPTLTDRVLSQEIWRALFPHAAQAMPSTELSIVKPRQRAHA